MVYVISCGGMGYAACSDDGVWGHVANLNLAAVFASFDEAAEAYNAHYADAPDASVVRRTVVPRTAKLTLTYNLDGVTPAVCEACGGPSGGGRLCRECK